MLMLKWWCDCLKVEEAMSLMFLKLVKKEVCHIEYTFKWGRDKKIFFLKLYYLSGMRMLNWAYSPQFQKESLLKLCIYDGDNNVLETHQFCLCI